MSRLLSRGRLAVIAVAALAVAVPSAAQAAPVHSRLVAAGLLPEPAAFSTLQIAQYDALYKTVQLDGDVDLDLLAANRSSRSNGYTWTATVGPEGEPTTVGTGRLQVAAGATERITVRFTIPDCLVRNRISVRLAADRGRSPEVHYWVLPHDSATWKTSGGPSCEA